MDVLEPISTHAILVLLIQLAALLLLARALAEGMRRIGQPAVIGELLAGVILGPTILGTVAPGLFTTVFPQETAQFQLLEVVSWLGMVLLLLLTGLETDIRAMRRLGRASLMASIFGMVVPFAGGLALGWVLPDRFLADPAARPIFAAFLATAMAISAMPVIAKILIDLDLIRRNVGMIILSAGVVDDTTGWLILSIIAGVAAGGTFAPAEFGLTLAYLGLFLAGMRWVAYPLLTRTIQYVNARVDLAGADITVILGFTFVSAAITEAIGVHAVFGAFLAGLLVRQVPRVRGEALHTIEVFVLSALSPIFFAFVGLRVDLWQLSGWWLPLVVIAVAIAGKMSGCYLGGRLGGLSHWESLALGFGMNARGAMELIVALIGLTLGLLTQEMYATIVMVAVVTSFMAPLLLRWALPHIPLGEDERRRIEASTRRALIPAGGLQILVPTAGGSNALEAMRLAAPLARHEGGGLTALYVHREGNSGPPSSRWRRRRAPVSLAGTNLDAHLGRAAEFMTPARERFRVEQVQGGEIAAAVLREAARDYDLVFLGAAPNDPLHDPLAQRVVRDSPVGVIVVRQPLQQHEKDAYCRLLVPFDGSLFARYAVEFAFAYAGATGAEVTVLHVAQAHRLASGSIPVPDRSESHPLERSRAREFQAEIEQAVAAVAAAHGADFNTRIIARASPSEAILDEARSGAYDLLILGAEDKLLGRPLFAGQGTAEIFDQAPCTTAVVLRSGD